MMPLRQPPRLIIFIDFLPFSPADADAIAAFHYCRRRYATPLIIFTLLAIISSFIIEADTIITTLS
jgi:hypothetical protein